LIEAVVFDFGHTLVDFALKQELLFIAHKEACGLVAGSLLNEVSETRKRIDEAVSHLNRRIEIGRVRQDLHELDVTTMFMPPFHDLGLEISASLKQQVVCLGYRALRAETLLCPTNAQVVRDLHAAGIRLALVSNFGLPGHLTRELLDDLGLLDHLDLIVLSAEEGTRKPDPRIYQAALARLGIEAGRAVFVGDRIGDDVVGPRAVGMRAILTRQFRREESEPAIVKPDRIIDRLVDLPAVITTLREAVDI
jgi:putative hydrolase of the HAD superfamily